MFVIIGLAAWLVIGGGLTLLIGGGIRGRERQVPVDVASTPAEPAGRAA